MILFRTDGNPTIGSGHVMRCLAIADAAQEQGVECRFVTADDGFAPAIRQRGFACDILQSDYRNMESERDALHMLLRKYRPGAILVDSYFVTADYLTWLGEFADVTYMDDLAAFAYPVKTLVNYNIYGPELDYAQLYQNAGVPVPRLLLGPRYAPLRKQFQQLPPRKISPTVKDIFVSTGGADPAHMALQLAQYLRSWPPASQYRFHFVVGAMNPDIDVLREAANKYSWMQLHENVQDMAGLMCRCDLAISAAGSTLYELCACGVPTIIYAFADNQLLGMEAFAEKDLMLALGDYRESRDFVTKLFGEIQLLVADSMRRERLSMSTSQLVKGKGAVKIFEELWNTCISRRTFI